MKDIAVEYLGGSGFLIGLGDTGMLFDASEHGADRRILPDKQALAAFKRMYVFISHHHDDHFSQSVYDLCGNDAVYIVGFDVPQPHRGVVGIQRAEHGNKRGAVHAETIRLERLAARVNPREDFDHVLKVHWLIARDPFNEMDEVALR